MAEREEAGRLPGEIVEVYRAPRSGGGTRDPREVIEVYRQPDLREVVEVYSRPVPSRREGRAAPSPMPAGERRRRKRGLFKFLACVSVLTVLALSARIADHLMFRDGGGPGRDYVRCGTEEISIPSWPVDQGVSLTLSRDQGETLTAQEVYRRVNPAVVTVQCLSGESVFMGTGIIFTEDGYVLTNYHVIEGGSRCGVIFDNGRAIDVCYVAGDEDSDLAVLKIPPGELQTLGGLPTASFGDSDLLVVGDTVYAIGAPRQLRGTLTNGIISAIDRDVEIEGKVMTVLQTNAALNSGNSGGPLINERGQVIGVNVAKYISGRERDNSVEGLGFAIPSAQMERIVNDLLKWGEVQPEPQLGVMVITDETGLLVKSVNPGAAAEAAGVRAGDYIIAAQGEPIQNTQDLFRVRRRLYVGDEVTFTLRRGTEILTVTLELEDAVE